MNGSHSIRSSKPLGAPPSYFLYPKISSPINASVWLTTICLLPFPTGL